MAVDNKIKVAFVSLGCPKNQVDAEMMLYTLKQGGFEIGCEEAAAQVIIINTCGFIEDAKAEAIENILEAAKYKSEGKCRLLIVTGCLAERYKDDVTLEIPEVDICVGIGANDKICEIISRGLKGDIRNYYGKKEDLNLNCHRILGGVYYSTYLKIGDGCNNCCTYCAIPEIRGKMRSRSIEDCVSEAQRLANNGVTELTVVAQDTTAYGTDLYGKPMLCELLSRLCKIEKLHWIRTLYTYPEHITDELLYLIKKEPKLVHYIDMPIQHCCGEILANMNRPGNEESLRTLIAHIREIIPDITIRTTLITGFPGESEEHFERLDNFVKQMNFSKLGCFAYSPEENTPAAGFDGQIEEQIRKDRAEHIMESQNFISARLNAEKSGTVQEVLIEGWDDYIKCYFGRTAADAPEIDGKIFFMADKPLVIGNYVKVRVNDTLDYDLLGELVREE